jgi:succinate dehydrogenase/fumarate reductase flavoprotein subunit
MLWKDETNTAPVTAPKIKLIHVRDKYGNLFDIYERITGEDAYRVPMRIYPAPHYTMGGLWVDYHPRNAKEVCDEASNSL